ncbi:MAG: hypothetical protein IMF19_14210 [Proteobacteria bacterium]|nr:hypothetical protein [Pseudomonadota bacterium]
MVEEGEKNEDEKQGYPRNEEFNFRKGEDIYLNAFSNLKLLLDNTIANAQRVNVDAASSSQINNAAAGLALQESIGLQKKLNDITLANMDAREKQRISQSDSTFNQRLEHENEIETTRQENMRYTLNYLYGVEGAEALGSMALAQGIVEMMQAKGLVEKKEK